MFFMPQDEKVRLRVKKMFETVVKKEGLEFLGWRAVPTVPSVLGKSIRCHAIYCPSIY